MAITREDLVSQSVQDYLRDQLFNVRGYPQDRVELMDAWQGEPLDTPLQKNYIALGFSFDDGGQQGEMGSDLTVRLYTIEFFIFGQSPTWGRNLANAVKFSLENDKLIPLKDISDPAKPVIDQLPLLSVSAERQPIPDPAEWQRNVWTVHLKIEDTYFANLV